MLSTQTDLFESELIVEETINNSEWGTFRDSLRAPVHGWFTYPAGFSYKAVENGIKNANLIIGKHTVYDPFMGSGTTNIVAKTLGFNSIGIEAHPFIFPITQSKMNWDIDLRSIEEVLLKIEKKVKAAPIPSNNVEFLKTKFPELILKCFLPETLFELLIIRESLNSEFLDIPIETIQFLQTGLICVLREVSIAATGWPYIAPKKIKITSMAKRGWETYKNRIRKMYSDIYEIKKHASKEVTTHQIFLGDSRNTEKIIKSNSADYIFTSPPYLNNFDYADRTRLEMYFMGNAKNWGEISNQVRTKLITSATTQISRNDPKYTFLTEFKNECPEVYKFLNTAVDQLSILRNIKGGKKSYDLMAIGYFNDLFKILKDNYRILKAGSEAVYILGDSAPYGVHIPTDEMIGKIGVNIGFKNYEIQVLRTRGGKWEKNPQRHNVALKESVVILKK